MEPKSRDERSQSGKPGQPAPSGELVAPKVDPRKVFPLGRLLITPGALAAIPEPDVRQALLRHAAGDWGTVGQQDWRENDLSIKEGFRILSAYSTAKGQKFWIITEADRSHTTILLPEEY